jgi:hypothetical protein
VADLNKNGTYAGNDVIVAFARLRNLTVVIHHLGQARWVVCGNEQGERYTKGEIHIAYHGYEHCKCVCVCVCVCVCEPASGFACLSLACLFLL